ncbi:helix-turn-helix transcriptional regulator [Pseudovibrio brasiliensis]|uniref:Helix-turn-helix transcriptional regulator n=2 Tax=Pseudovibrio brasiliensis TaxID=1898042 RepID=A0ABX8ALZ4_9HYPH|nr:helix-turn-helix transcriptional regulator [Pseudovibrio brasiliensis]
MIMNQQIAEYCSANTLLIPESLHDMADARLIMSDGKASVFHKLIRDDMRDIEFFTSTPCLAFVISGRESFSSAEHEEFVLNDGEMLFMGRDLHMISDFTNEDGPLEAVLFFFDTAVIAEFLKRKRIAEGDKAAAHQPFKVEANASISEYVAGLKSIYKDLNKAPSDLVRMKLLELLSLVDLLGHEQRLLSFLIGVSAAGKRRNIKHLMRNGNAYNLSVKDFAKLSGRSVSSFNRDFKRLNGVTPSKWLLDARLEKARELVFESKLSVTEIAMQIGFANTSHFIKAFKGRYDETPKQARLAYQDSFAG